MDRAGVKHFLDHAPEWRHVGFDLFPQIESFAVRHDRKPVIAKRAGDDDTIAGD